MSLLLDALKKAAQEKQNADSADIKAEADAGLSLQQETDSVSEKNHFTIDDTSAHEELELELDDDVLSPVYTAKEDSVPVNKEPVSDEYKYPRLTSTPSTVTDEALQLLIHKTNDEHKKTRLMTWGGVVLGALILLSIIGFYFYGNMIDEIESMQRKHQIALATLKSKTKIEENLTSLAVVPEQNRQGKQDTGSIAKTSESAKSSTNDVSGYGAKQPSNLTFSVQRAEVRDPISEGLQRGWMAYQKQDYESSKHEYKKVLNDEPNNHDALLGVAAVSLQQGDVETAKDIYLKLLERDPRDPHAHAGLANIAQNSGADLSETRLKQLIEFRPDDYAYNLAVSLDQLGKHKEARAYYENSLKLATGKNISFSQDAVKSRLVYLGTL